MARGRSADETNVGELIAMTLLSNEMAGRLAMA
jgi:hypothetical protein